MKLKPSERREIVQALGLFTHIGLTMAISIGGCIWVGNWIDKQLGTTPWLMLVFVIIGCASAICGLFRIVKSVMNK